MKILLTLFLSIFAFQFSFGQEILKAEKVDEFDNRCDESVMARIANFASFKTSYPKTTSLIIFYGNEIDEGKNLSLIDWYKFYSKGNGFEVSVIRGANQKAGKTEFWIVPEGAETPKPVMEFIPPVYKTKIRFDKADAFIEPFNTKELQPNHSEFGCQLQPNLSEFAKTLLSNNELNGQVVVDNRSRGLASSVAQIIIQKLTETYKVPRNRFRLNFRYKSEFGETQLLFIPKKKHN